MDLIARQFKPEEDYPIIAEWWPAHGWNAVPAAIIPKCGIIIENGDQRPMAFACLYMDNSIGVAMMEWTVTNPANTPRESLEAIKHLIGAIKETAILFDYGVVLTSSNHEALIRVYERNGFGKTDTGMTHLIMLTKPEAQ